MLVTKSLAGVIEHNMKYANKGSTLVLKPRADVEKTKILDSESFARWLVSLALVLALALELELAIEIELALALDIERYRITASVNHLTCPLPPHQSVI